MKLFTSVKLTYLEKIFFTKQLAMFLKAGIPLDEALKSLSEEEKANSVSRVAKSIQSQVENGQTLSKALASEPRSFNLFFVSMVEIGEVSGTLEKSLDFLAGKLLREAELRKKIQAMLYYPAVVLAAAFVVGGFVSFFVLPKLGKMFQSFNVKLPIATRILIFLSDFIKNYGFFVVLALLSLVVIFLILLSIWPKFKFLWHKTKLSLPIFGKVIADVALSAFFRNLAVMLSSGLTLEYALRIESETAENLVVKLIAAQLEKNISQGQRIGDSLKNIGDSIFPLFVSRIISVGEVSGKLEESFSYLADFFEDETEVKAKNAVAIFEPLVIVLIAMVVGFVALAVVMPIYSLTGSIH
jgi:type IV pilus assembly protein PilC